MALTDQPYLPLYVDDLMNNNKLKMCSMESHGLLLSIMCVMHKEDDYGKILLKQKFKQSNNQVENFANQLAKLTAFDFANIVAPLQELIDEKVLLIDGDIILSKRMVKDAELSLKRSKAGKKGGVSTHKKSKDFDKDFAKAKNEANTVIENVNEIVIENENIIEPKKVVDLYHQFCKNLPKVKVLSDTRKRTIKLRLSQHGLNKINQVFQLAGQSDFMNGSNKEGWTATFDWIMKTNNFIKVLEGNFDNKNSNNSGFKKIQI